MPYNNMVESTPEEKGPEELTSLCTAMMRVVLRRITVKDFEFDLKEFEEEEAFEKANEEAKILLVVKNSEKAIRKWNDELSLEHDVAKMSYDRWKKLACEQFASTPETIGTFFALRQGAEEEISEYLHRMEVIGRKLKLTGAVRLEAIKKGITRNVKALCLEMLGEERITDRLIKRLKEREALERQFRDDSPRRWEPRGQGPSPRTTYRPPTCFRCRKPGHIAPDCPTKKDKSVNEIVQAASELNKDHFIYVDGRRIQPTFDTGAGDSYITMPMVEELGLSVARVEPPRQRATCLGQTFCIAKEVALRFTYRAKQYEERCGVLPLRQDSRILLGRSWIERALDPKQRVPAVDGLDRGALLELLYKGRPEGITADYECRIDTPAGAQVVEGTAAIPQALESRVEAAISRAMEKDHLELSDSAWCSKLRPVEKPTGEVRLTTNLIALNALVALDRYSLPKIEQLIHTLEGKAWFSKLDMKDGFFQIPLRTCDRHKTAFRFKNRLYQWKKMPMGFKNAPAVFQRYMDMALAEEIGNACYVYVDDILVFGRTKEEHDRNVLRVLRRLVQAGLQANPEKCTWDVQETEFLGHRLSPGKIEPMGSKIEAISSFGAPTSLEEVRRFLGMVGYYRKFIPHCADLMEPINELTKKDTEFVWSSECQQGFERLKAALTGNTVLVQPDFSRTFILETDASNKGVGAILTQATPDGERPVAYASRKLQPAEQNYSITEKEMLGALWAMEHFEYFLYGREFKLRTDHKALEAFNTKGSVDSARVQRWAERLARYSFVVEYRRGEEMAHADALSRPNEQEVNEISAIGQSRVIFQAHEKTLHRGARATLEHLKQQGQACTENEVRRVIANCPTCKMYNSAKTRQPKHIESWRVGEKAGFDIIGPIEGEYILTVIDYFTRQAMAKVLGTRRTERVLESLKEAHEKWGILQLVSDGAKENYSRAIREWREKEGIRHHLTSPHHPQSNGRIERFNQTLMDMVQKDPDQSGRLRERVARAVEAYNNAHHRIIGMSPNEAVQPGNWEELRRREMNVTIAHAIQAEVSPKWSQLKADDQVLIKNEHHSKGQPRFNTLGTITQELNNDAYLIRTEKGSTMKRHISQLKLIS